MTPLPDPALPWPIPMPAVAIIAESEGLRLSAYRCPAGVPTIGRGRTDGVTMGDVCTREQADRWLCDDLIVRTKAVRAMCTREPSANELGAFVSLAYNIGVEALRKSTALRCHNEGRHEAAARAICLWDKARVNGVLTTLPGLTARRAKEQALYLTPDEPIAERLPQAVESESSLAKSPIARGGAAAVGTAAVGGLGAAAEAVGALKGGLSGARDVLVNVVGVPVAWLPWIVLGVVGVVVWQARWKQRREGWV